MRAAARPSPLILLAACWATITGSVYGQSTEASVEDLQAPSVPSFTILGAEPTSIARPSSPRAVGLSLLSSITDANDLIPKNYALEVAPFWLKSHPDLTYERYTSSGVGATMLQTAAFSVATTTRQDGTVGMGLGARTLVLKGRHNATADASADAILDLQRQVLLTSDVEEENRLLGQLREAALTFQAEARNRVGWVLELAAAVGAAFPDAAYDAGEVTRYGIWATPAYRWENRFGLMGVLRYLQDEQADVQSQELLDVGARLQLEVQRLALSAEYVSRISPATDSASERQSSSRLVGAIDYRINEDLYMTSSFGKNYEDPMTGQSGLVTFLGLNFRLSSRPTVRLE